MITRERLTLGLLLASLFAIRAIHLDQPIVENYVGRQIPTAMVARNLERGSGFLHPQLDTGPWPNLFLVEPPIYAQLVASSRPIFGWALEPTGRLISAAGVVLGAWGLYGLVRRREGVTVAFLALASFGLFPVMVRYGRAFQPDALMIGCVLAGLRGWDEYEAGGQGRWAIFGGFVFATGLALKITVGWALIPFGLILRRWPIGWRLAMAGLMLVPAALWYLHAWKGVADPGVGSMASTDNAGLWWKSLSIDAWLHWPTYETIGRGLVFRSFTPVGFVLAMCGLLGTGKLDRLWIGWGLGCTLAIVGLATKWHHAYYWMVVAPLAAVGVGRALACLAKRDRWGRPIAFSLGSFLLAMAINQSSSTFKTPDEWKSLDKACRQLQAINPGLTEIAAAEATLYYADLKGYRLELNGLAMKRAAGEWGFTMNETTDPLALVDFYCDLTQVQLVMEAPVKVEDLQENKASSLRDSERPLLAVDVGSIENEPRRRAWREALRKRPRTRILVDQPGYLIAELR